MASRTAVAEYLAEHLTTERDKALRQVAAWLVATGRTRDARYVTRDAAQALVKSGYAAVRVYTARPLEQPAREAATSFVRQLTGAETVELEELVDPSLIGGIRLETPTAELDATVRRRLALLVEGAQ